MRGNPPLIRKINRKSIVRAIEQEFPLSRTELSRRIGLSLPSVSRIVDALLEEKLLREVGKGDSSGGRRPRLLAINAAHRYVFGAEISRTASLVLCDLSGKILDRSTLRPDISRGPISLARQISREVELMRKHASLPCEMIAGVGVGTPGYMFKSSENITLSPFFGWHCVDAEEVFTPLFPYPVFIENIARASTLAEMIFGWGREYRNFFYAYLDWGTGGGMVYKGEVVRGRNRAGGEFGHTVIEYSGVPCYCGNRGCLEQYTSTSAITREVHKRLRSRDGNRVSREDFDWIVQAFEAGDPMVCDVLVQSGRMLGRGIANVINLFNPEAVILGGEISRRCPLYCEEAITTAREHIFSLGAADTPIVRSSVKTDVVALGAARQAISWYFETLV